MLIPCHLRPARGHSLDAPTKCSPLVRRSIYSSAHGPNVLIITERIHGGSFYAGSATYPGLDGSQLAVTSGSIVAVVQYRLGVLGFLPPTGASGGVNLGVQDVTQALSFLHTTVSSFGTSLGKVTVAGQSSGAAMIRGEHDKDTSHYRNILKTTIYLQLSLPPRRLPLFSQTESFKATPCSITSSPIPHTPRFKQTSTTLYPAPPHPPQRPRA